MPSYLPPRHRRVLSRRRRGWRGCLLHANTRLLVLAWTTAAALAAAACRGYVWGDRLVEPLLCLCALGGLYAAVGQAVPRYEWEWWDC